MNNVSQDQQSTDISPVAHRIHHSKKSFASWVSADILFGGGNALLTLITLPVLIRNLGADRFGDWALVLSLVGLLSLINLGLHITQIEKMTTESSCKGSLLTYTNAFFAQLSVTAILIFAMPFMAGLLYKLYGRGDLVMAFVIAATFNSLATLGGVATSALAAKGYGYIAAIISGASALAQTVQLFSISFMSSDLTTISLFQTSIPIFATSLLFYFAKRKCGLSIRTKYFDYLRYKDFFVKGRFLQVSHISEVAAANFPQIAIHAILGPAYVTLYAVAVKIPSLITNTFIMKMVSASFPFFRQLWSLKKFRQYWSYHTFVQYYSAVLGTYLLIAFYLYFPDILRIWGFHDYADLQWLGLGVGLLSLRESLVRSTGIFVISTGDYKYASKMSLIDTVTMVSVSTSLMGTFGVQAIFFGNLISGIMLITMIALFKISFSPRATSHRIYYIRCCYFLLLFVTLQFIGKLSPTWYIGTSILICLMMAELLLVAKTGLGSRHLLSLLRC